MNVSGVIIIDKPAGWTSHDVVAKLRRVLGQKRVGHGGTLDPMATGVLPVFVGRATRAAGFCENAEKEYIAGLRFGIVTDTQDITGTVLKEADINDIFITADDLRILLPSFLGHRKQIPPMFSAIKQNGKKLYELARRGIVADRPAREIEITDIEFIEEPAEYNIKVPDMPIGTGGTNQTYYFRIACSKGTYIRTICHDIGEKLGCGAVMSYLRRIRAGVYTIDKAHTLDDIMAAEQCKYLLPADSIFSQYPALTLNEADTCRAKNGALQFVRTDASGLYRIYAPDGEFLLLGEVADDKLKVIKSFFEL